MKFSNIKKSLVVGAALAGASLSANAGVVATSYLDVQSFGIIAFYDEAMTNPVLPTDLANFISVSSGTRSSSTSATFNGNGLAPDPVFAPDTTGVGTADGTFVCTGPSCGAIGVSNNSLVGDFLTADSIHGDSITNGYSYGVADAIVSGSALVDPTVPASGMTYAAASLSGNGVAGGNSDISDSLTTFVEFAVQGVTELYLAFTTDYSLVVKTDVTPDIDADPSQVANATASGIFSVGLGTDNSDSNGGALAYDFGGGFVDISNRPLFTETLVTASDDTTGSDTGVSESGGSVESGFFRIGAGDFQVSITQESSARVSLVSAPGTLAIAGLGLLGLAAVRRRKS